MDAVLETGGSNTQGYICTVHVHFAVNHVCSSAHAQHGGHKARVGMEGARDFSPH